MSLPRYTSPEVISSVTMCPWTCQRKPYCPCNGTYSGFVEKLDRDTNCARHFCGVFRAVEGRLAELCELRED